MESAGKEVSFFAKIPRGVRQWRVGAWLSTEKDLSCTSVFFGSFLLWWGVRYAKSSGLPANGKL